MDVDSAENDHPRPEAAAIESPQDEVNPEAEGSSSSDLAIARTSTEEFHHVPFDKFTSQVKDLCNLLWHPDNPSRVDRIFRGRSAGIIGKLRGKAKIIAAKQDSSSNEFTIERMTGGGFNRVIGITRFPDRDSPTRLILRIPRFEFARHDREVAALRFVRAFTTVPVPEIKYLDFTTDNPLNEPYVIQSRVPGFDLQTEHGPSWYPSLTHQQQCAVARDLAESLKKLYNVTHPFPGHIEASNTNDDSKTFSVHHFELNWNSGPELEQDLNRKSPFFQAHAFKSDWESTDSGKKAFEETTFYFMLAQFGRWKALDLRRDPTSIAWMDYYDRLVGMAKQVDELGFLDCDNCLCHRDLNSAPRNIMADFNADGDIGITGILDWDSLVFAPRFVACIPPMWLWAWDDEEEEDEAKAADEPASPEQQEIKRIFEEIVGDEFCQYAYAPVYRFARGLFKQAYSGMSSDTDMHDVDELVAGWNALYQSAMASGKATTVDQESMQSPVSKMEEESG